MTDQSNAVPGLAAALIVLLGPVLGQYLAIVLAALVGGFWALSARPPEPALRAALFLFRMVGTAVVFAGTLSYLVDQKTGLGARNVLAGVAFLIAFYGERLRTLLDAVWARAIRIVDGRAPPDRQGADQGEDRNP